MLAGIVMKGGGYGLLWDIIVGLSESIVESGLFQALGCRTLMIVLQRKIWPAQVAHA